MIIACDLSTITTSERDQMLDSMEPPTKGKDGEDQSHLETLNGMTEEEIRQTDQGTELSGRITENNSPLREHKSLHRSHTSGNTVTTNGRIYPLVKKLLSEKHGKLHE